MSRGPEYCRGALKRGCDLAFSVTALVALSPLLLAIAMVNLACSGWPVLFLQERVGSDGRPFRMAKFRTMRRDAASGLPLTGAGDVRVTRLGRFLRAAKLDELPQLYNVVRGEMSLVGPRPEMSRYVDRYSKAQRRVLETRPGLTDPASVLFRDEELLLGAVPEAEREDFYLKTVLPRKLEMNLEYIDRAGFWYDVVLVVKTMGAVLAPGRTAAALQSCHRDQGAGMRPPDAGSS